MAICITLYAYKYALSTTQGLSEEIKEVFNINTKNLLLYPAAQLVIYSPIIIYNLIHIWIGYTYYPLLVVTSFWSLGGFINFYIYGHMLHQHKRALINQIRTLSLDALPSNFMSDVGN